MILPSIAGSSDISDSAAGRSAASSTIIAPEPSVNGPASFIAPLEYWLRSQRKCGSSPCSLTGLPWFQFGPGL